jgi:O-antigen/teichoic acid export membrane protein
MTLAPFHSLRSAGRWLMQSGTASVVANTTLTRVLLLAVNFATGVVIARFLGPSGRGALSALIILPPLMSSLFTFGLPSALLFYARTGVRERTALFTVSMLLTAALSVLMILAGIVAVPYMLHQYDATTIRAAQWLLLLAPEIMLSYIINAFLQATDRFDQFNQQRVLPAVFTLSALLVVKIAGGFSPLTAALCYLLPPIPVFVYGLWRMRDIIGISFTNAKSEAARLLHYGSRACGIDILGTVAQQADQVLVVALLSATSMGIYTVALSVSRVPNLVFNAMSDVIASKTIGMPPVEMTAFVGRAARISALAGAVLAIGIAAALPLALPAFYGSDFRAAITITDILLIELIASGVASILAVAFLAAGRPAIVTFIRGGSLIVAIPLLFALIPHFGLVGAASALLISSAARVLGFALLYRSAIGTNPPSLILTLDDLRFIRRRLSGQNAYVPV